MCALDIEFFLEFFSNKIIFFLSFNNNKTNLATLRILVSFPVPIFKMLKPANLNDLYIAKQTSSI